MSTQVFAVKRESIIEEIALALDVSMSVPEADWGEA